MKSSKSWPTIPPDYGQRNWSPTHVTRTELCSNRTLRYTKVPLIITDVAVSWEGNTPLSTSWANKKGIYNNPKFLEAAALRWPNKTIRFLPLVVGARGVWPRANKDTETELQLTTGFNSSCVQSTLKWGSSIHKEFMASVWKRRPGPQR